ncbi:hypothetical protein CH299_28160 [Rhodococcus sp. 14-2686-1-2]|nr:MULTISPECIES: hypothetical protein [unclassified Rhodococcus (in: high G+C Gram-positive bacteria)]OZE93127.1 hypothetical protein CH301_27640 [Rhodococcus sp. 15-1189-1-1a]OZF08056.1 hypothetical protein CH299_28160 [Rhodococcus sp. 14-2686-1-2]
MRIRTIDGPPLPAEIAEHAARAIALRRLLDRKITDRPTRPRASDAPQAATARTDSPRSY